MRQDPGFSLFVLSCRALDHLGIPLEVRHHPQARRCTLRVSRTRRAVIITLPAKGTPGEAALLLHRHLTWIETRVNRLPPAAPFTDGALIPLRGTTCRLRFSASRRRPGRAAVHLVHPPSDSEPAEILVEGSGDAAARRVRRWLTTEARRDLSTRVAVHAAALGVRPAKISIRDQFSRWGSCSPSGALSFSWRLILAPSFVLDYVAAHETAHLSEMNHGPRFWDLVCRLISRTRMEEAKGWLKKNGLDLYRYGCAHPRPGGGSGSWFSTGMKSGVVRAAAGWSDFAGFQGTKVNLPAYLHTPVSIPAQTENQLAYIERYGFVPYGFTSYGSISGGEGGEASTFRAPGWWRSYRR